MDNLKYSKDSDHEWQTVCEPVIKDSKSQCEDAEDKLSTVIDNKRGRLSAPVLTFQLILCLLALIFCFISKNFLPDIFHRIKEVYDKEINASVFCSGDFFGLDYSQFFGATDDEV